MADATGSTALLAWIQAFGSLSRVPQKVSDLSDGLVFGEVLKLMYVNAFLLLETFLHGAWFRLVAWHGLIRSVQRG